LAPRLAEVAELTQQAEKVLDRESVLMVISCDGEDDPAG
jgi:hypothetical protein